MDASFPPDNRRGPYKQLPHQQGQGEDNDPQEVCFGLGQCFELTGPS